MNGINSSMDGVRNNEINDIYQQTRNDLFILRAYKIIADNPTLNLNHIQSAMVTKFINDDVKKNKAKKISIHPQYAKTFNKIAKIYNSFVIHGIFNDGTNNSTTSKQPIEFFNRFQQILKEIENDFSISPYNKYFLRINDNLYQIKDDVDLQDDQFWNLLSNKILNFYNQKTGKLINQGRRKYNRKSVVTPESTENNKTNDDNFLNNFLDDSALLKKLQDGSSNGSSNSSNTNNNNNNPASGNGTFNSRSLSGYYTQPTSPGLSSSFPFTLSSADEDLLNNTLNINGTSGKKRSLSAFHLDNLGNENTENSVSDDILKFTNIAKKQKVDSSTVFENVENDLVSIVNNTKKDQLLESIEGELLKDGASYNTNKLKDIEKMPTTNSSTDGSDMQRQLTSDLTNNASNTTGTTDGSSVRDRTTLTSSSSIATDAMNEMQVTYKMMVNEKEKQIQRLESELESQRQETLWLRKLLIEDMGFVRNYLQDIKRR
ncbi:hypothetical protein KAFR_0F00270 [Kazachstania africana CBS 2517]|uniref:Uncharacterized protein n=1 Tax=Kazachstania africana (strain ATCC 22294 / BCRC 22015 / CBS 2517 / CECT 1963 / NBRC 1671 / NRRL Y-8276) TaxID=1071382 RepID=H2AW74_KAZAF|nr:hypothetical protein KAFR_0F00270 [Kazachstania africana CBS 2517]CCF58624.1 hypothetical protein KAFR_0F00270 [Kazachstania africana CBS 2517]